MGLVEGGVDDWEESDREGDMVVVRVAVVEGGRCMV